MAHRKSQVESAHSHPRRAGEAFEATWWDKVRVNSSVVRRHNFDVLRALRKGEPNHLIAELGNSFKENGRFPEVAGLDLLEAKVRDIKTSEREPHLLVVGNHPDFLRAGLEKPLWYMTVLYVIGEVMGEDPYVFVSGKLSPEFLERRTHALRVWDGKTTEIFEKVEVGLKDREVQKCYFILPEGQSCREDRMVAARTGATFRLVEIAVKNKIPLAVLPIALVQETVYRNEVKGKKDVYAVHIGEEIYADELLKEGYGRSTAELRGRVVDEIMTRVAEMLPDEKQGFYRDFVERRETRGIMPTFATLPPMPGLPE
jgi:hypothetical protein